MPRVPAFLGWLGIGLLTSCNLILDIHDHDIAPGAAGSGDGASAGTSSGGAGGTTAGRGGSSAQGGTGGQVTGAGGTAGAADAGAGMGGESGGSGSIPACGNGMIDGSDACDDGNTDAGDGCGPTCQVEKGFTCDAKGCTAICGDGLLVGVETEAGGCDDHNGTANDGCTDCTVDPEYVCSGTPSRCEKTCGNGILEGAEQCDDGNTKTDDGCVACAIHSGFTCDTSQDPSTCSDVDECTSMPDACDPHATCTNTVGSYSCECNGGYTGSGASCKDVNECQTGMNNCAANATCTNTPGSFSCACNPGFAGNGVTCNQNSCDGLTATCGKSGNEDCCSTKTVTGGTYYRSYNGSDYTDKSFPATVSTFHLDRFEVTVARFRKFVAAWRAGWRPSDGDGKHTHLNGGSGLVDSSVTGTVYEKGWSLAWESSVTLTDYDLTCQVEGAYGYPSYTVNPGTATQEKRAMNCVNWYEAYAFCIWDGAGFLPTETEWDYAAAGGTDQRIFPWPNGTGLDCGKANYNPGTYCSSPVGPLPVGGTSTGGDSKFGQADMAGNVWEWVQDSYDNYHSPCTNCASLEDDFLHMARGGDFASDSTLIESAARASRPIQNHASELGFRCGRP